MVVVGIDRARRTAWAFRDPVGLIPLYYTVSQGRLTVATDATLVAQRAALPVEPDAEFLALLLSLRLQLTRRSPLRQVASLLPGELLMVSAAGGTERHWQGAASWPRRITRRPAEPLGAHWQRAVADAVGRQLPVAPDQPVGIMLSGGLDSSAILSTLVRHYPERPRAAISWTVPAFPPADESEQIRAAAAYSQTPLTLVDCSEVWPGQSLEQRIGTRFPLLNPFQPLIERVYEAAASAGTHWIFNGHGGDSLFAVHRHVVRDALFAAHGRAFAAHLAHRLRRSTRAPWRDPAIRELGRALVGWRSRVSTPPWLTTEAASALAAGIDIGAAHPHPEQMRSCLAENPVPGAWLEQQTASSWSVARRTPLQDAELIRLALTLPADRMLDVRGRKRLALEAFGGQLPSAVAHGNRTGLLSDLLHEGLFVRERRQLDQLLDQSDALWPTIVRREFVEGVIRAPRQHRSSAWLLVWMCWCLTLWEQQLKALP